MLKMLILICAAGVSPADCRPQLALDVIRGPDVASPMLCGLHGQAYVAESALANRRRDDEYLKIVCVKAGARTALATGVAEWTGDATSASAPR